MDALDAKISQWLRITRQARGWGLRQASVNSWVTTSVLSRIENGSTAATIQTLVRLCHGFDITAEAFAAEIGLGEIPFDGVKEQVSILEAGRHLQAIRKHHQQTLDELAQLLRFCKNTLIRIENGKINTLRFSHIVELERQYPGENILTTFWAVYNSKIKPYFVVYERPSGICTWSAEAYDPDHLIRGLLRQYPDILQITSMEVDTWPEKPNRPLKVARYNLWIQEKKA